MSLKNLLTTVNKSSIVTNSKYLNTDDKRGHLANSTYIFRKQYKCSYWFLFYIIVLQSSNVAVSYAAMLVIYWSRITFYLVRKFSVPCVQIPFTYNNINLLKLCL